MMLTPEEIQTFERGKQANPHYFRSLVHAVGVMSDRVKKYSGKNDPYLNFIIFSRAKGIPVSECFVDYELIKWARNLVATGDFGDESSADTEADLGNYANIGGGWLTRSPFERIQAELRCGRWVCWDDAIAAGLIDKDRLIEIMDDVTDNRLEQIKLDLPNLTYQKRHPYTLAPKTKDPTKGSGGLETDP